MLLDELNITIPEYRVEETSKMIGILGEQVVEEFPWIDDMRPSTADQLEGVLRRTWKPALSIVGAEGLPARFPKEERFPSWRCLETNFQRPNS